MNVLAIPVTESSTLTEAQFQEISALVKSLCGINLHDGKKELVKARLAKRLRQLSSHGLSGFGDYIEMVRKDASGAEITAMLDALSTNLTQFFRENQHFELLVQKVVPEFMKKNRAQARLRLWSAGCSSGEEPYSMAISLRDAIPELATWDVRILATDLSTRVLTRAGEGVYPAERLAGVTSQIVTKHFAPVPGHGKTLYRVQPHLRNMITFGRLNLMENWPMRGPFDAIFCRNVMIYFDKPTQDRLVNRFWGLLAPGGHLFVGHSESLAGIKHQFEYVQPAVYRRAG
jgi:chemotaxis protein methyltransferase CheR